MQKPPQNRTQTAQKLFDMGIIKICLKTGVHRNLQSSKISKLGKAR